MGGTARQTENERKKEVIIIAAPTDTRVRIKTFKNRILNHRIYP